MNTEGSLVLAIAVGFLFQGCVSASKHERLQRDYDRTATELSDCKKLGAADGLEIRDQENKIHDSEVVIKDLESRLGSTASAKSRLEGNVSEMKVALEALTKQRADAEKRIQEFHDFLKKFRSLIDTGKLTVKIVDGQMVVALSSDILFPSGSARLSDEGIESIRQVTALLVSVPDRKFQIEGFTDDVPIRTAVYPSNWELAAARSLTVVKTMLDAGIPPERISSASFGETHPVQKNDTDKGRTANRRIEIVVVPDLSSLPGYDQLQKMSSPD